jgi:hypothetical protein
MEEMGIFKKKREGMVTLTMGVDMVAREGKNKCEACLEEQASRAAIEKKTNRFPSWTGKIVNWLPNQFSSTKRSVCN